MSSFNYLPLFNSYNNLSNLPNRRTFDKNVSQKFTLIIHIILLIFKQKFLLEVDLIQVRYMWNI